MYLCYDLKGIQRFIFQIPRLKFIVGGSALIDEFDRVTVRDLAQQRGWRRISSAGGKGAFHVEDIKTAKDIEQRLTKEAHRFGADVQFGLDEDFVEASHSASRLYPYLPAPEELDGHPCPQSGLYPTAEDCHPIVKRRDWSRGDRVSRRFEERLQPHLKGVERPVFVRDVEEGTPGHRALGGRGRWAIICMDGNAMGSQFRTMVERRVSDADMCRWLERMSVELDACSEAACVAGMNRVLSEWIADASVRQLLRSGRLTDGDGDTVVPLRPLVVGGDDIAVLCHASYADSFVLEACRSFQEESQARAKKALQGEMDLWPGTGGSLTISAGLLYCGTTLPLAAAIPYAETLLASAKARGRNLISPSEPTAAGRGALPACIDFEAVTETLLDHPLARRARDLVFLDGDLGDVRVELTRRPYTIEQFESLVEELRRPGLLTGVPNTLLHELLPGLRQSHSDRAVFYARIGKHHASLLRALDEGSAKSTPENSRWRRTNGVHGVALTTDLVDLAILAEESRRMEWSNA